MKDLHRTILTVTLSLLLGLTAPICAAAQPQDGLKSDTYTYVQRDSALLLDVYKPAVPREDKAAVISLFGGGFFMGERNNALSKEIAKSLTDRGYTVISIDYRLGFRDRAKVAENSTVFKATGLFRYCIDIAVQDCAAAVSWVCSNAQDLDIDPDRIILTGSSAGAITVLQLDYCRANSLPEASELPQGWKPAGVVTYSGGVMCRKWELKYATSPAPTMLMHGTKDRIVAYKSFGLPFSQKMFGAKKVDKAMDRQDIPHWFIKFDGLGHEVANWLPGSVDLFCTFAELTLAGRITSLDATMTDSRLNPTSWSQMSVFDLYGKRKK